MSDISDINDEIKRAVKKFQELSAENQDDMLATHKKDLERLFKTYDRVVSGRNPWKSTLHLIAYTSAKNFYESLLAQKKDQ